MSYVLLVGDTHTTKTAVSHPFFLAEQYDAEHILQLGDFGFWPNHPLGAEFLDLTNSSAEATGIEFVFVDGNHEDHDELEKFEKTGGLVNVLEHVLWAPRGSRWEWAGRTFGALGGAFSPDFGKKAGIPWFEYSEYPTPLDLETLGPDHLDVLATHDVPETTVPIKFSPLPDDMEARAQAPKQLIERAIQITRPSLVVHGHIHHRHTTNHRLGARVEGFTCDGKTGTYGLLDLETLEVTDIG